MIELYPYTINDGVPSVRDSELNGLYSAMEKEGSLNVVYYNMSQDDITPEWWLWYMKEHCKLFVILESEKDIKQKRIVGITWLSNIVGKRADIHYCLFEPGWGRSAEICKEALKKMFTITKMDCLIALVPETNARAFNKPSEYGFKGPVIIPQACYIALLGKSVAGYQYHSTRKKQGV